MADRVEMSKQEIARHILNLCRGYRLTSAEAVQVLTMVDVNDLDESIVRRMGFPSAADLAVHLRKLDVLIGDSPEGDR